MVTSYGHVYIILPCAYYYVTISSMSLYNTLFLNVQCINCVILLMYVQLYESPPCYTFSQKQLQNLDSLTDFQFLCTKIKIINFYSDDKNFTMLHSTMYKWCGFKVLKISQNLHANMKGFRRASHLYSAKHIAYNDD